MQWIIDIGKPSVNFLSLFHGLIPENSDSSMAAANKSISHELRMLSSSAETDGRSLWTVKAPLNRVTQDMLSARLYRKRILNVI